MAHQDACLRYGATAGCTLGAAPGYAAADAHVQVNISCGVFCYISWLIAVGMQLLIGRGRCRHSRAIIVDDRHFHSCTRFPCAAGVDPKSFSLALARHDEYSPLPGDAPLSAYADAGRLYVAQTFARSLRRARAEKAHADRMARLQRENFCSSGMQQSGMWRIMTAVHICQRQRFRSAQSG